MCLSLFCERVKAAARKSVHMFLPMRPPLGLRLTVVLAVAAPDGVRLS